MQSCTLTLTLALTLLLVIIALGQAAPTASGSLSRQKRGFKANSASRVAHGYGKRNFSWGDDASQMMAVSELAQLAAGNPSLTEALIERFVDVDGNGMVSSQELLGDQ